MAVAHLSEESPYSCEVVLITICHWILFWARWIHSSCSHCYFTHILIKIVLTSISAFPNCCLSFKSVKCCVDVCSILCGLFVESRTTDYDLRVILFCTSSWRFLMSRMRSACTAYVFPLAISAYINDHHVPQPSPFQKGHGVGASVSKWRRGRAIALSSLPTISAQCTRISPEPIMQCLRPQRTALSVRAQGNLFSFAHSISCWLQRYGRAGSHRHRHNATLTL
jgi:hypothetical protein